VFGAMPRKLTLVLAGLLGIAVIVGVAVTRAMLPQTACNVSYAQYRALPMKISYDKAKGLLGCDGVLVSRQADDGKPVLETYAWRGAAWLYGRVEAGFINNSLEMKSLNLADVFSQQSEMASTDEGRRHLP